jgi:signal transduction histidine kinase
MREVIKRASSDRPISGPAGRDEGTRAFVDEFDDPSMGLLHLMPTRRQTRAAHGAAAALLVIVASLAPFAATPLPHFAAFIPLLNAMILVTDLITAILLFVQFSISRSRALLVLAGGYLFTSLIVIPHALTFPGAFSPTGLLGAGLQTTAWLYILWHLGFPTALMIYVLLKDRDYIVRGSIQSAISWCVAIIVCLVPGIVWMTIAWEPLLPRIFLSASQLTPSSTNATMFDLAISAIALAALWIRRRSVLDLWLMVVACALVGELAITIVRFSLGFYVSRMLSLTTSTIVLIILLAETAGLYTRLARTNMMLRRERDNKLMNLEAVVASISHEVKQPLATIVMSGSSALRFLGHTPPDHEKARSALSKIVGESRRASQIFDSIRDLFRTSDREKVPIDANALIRGALDIVHGDLKEHRVTVRTELIGESPVVVGHLGQLQEVLLNLIRNAIEAMDGTAVRVLTLRTESRDHEGLVISVIDTGPGIDPEKLDRIFDAFVTTKPRGMGLGLAICRMIIERHGGQLLASPGGSGGALFQIILPFDQSAGFLPARKSVATQEDI